MPKPFFKGDAATFGYINSFIGLGAVCRAIFLATAKQGADLKFVLFVNTIIFGICLILFSHAAHFAVAMIFAVVIGFGTMSQSTICNTIAQVNSAQNMRGRVISLLLMALGVMPMGGALIGAIGERIGASNALLCQGIAAIIIAAVFANFLTRERREKKNAGQLKHA